MAFKSVPKLSASMTQSPLYDATGLSSTDGLFLIGHADGLALNSPYRVTNMREAIDKLNADTDSPVLRAMLQAYYAGARDIWLVASAPMSEYEPDLANRDATYYNIYLTRLEDSYDALEFYDMSRINVPLEAPFNSTIDFLTPLVNYCVKSFNRSGEISMGILGTRGEVTQELAEAMLQDPRLDDRYGTVGRYVSIFAGEGGFNYPELPINGTGSFAPTAAAMLSRMPLVRGLSNAKMEGAINLIGPNITEDVAESLAVKGVNLIARNLQGRRGKQFSTVALTDNTLAPEDSSSFWSIGLTRLIAQINEDVRAIAAKHIGKVAIGQLRQSVDRYMLSLMNQEVIRSYTANVERDPKDRYRAFVDLHVLPYNHVRNIEIPIRVGPNSSRGSQT